jgi:Mg-chelatase subunit ChlI
MDQPTVMPLPAVVGQERVKRGLLMLAANPRLGGLLIRGERGTGKSTLARGLARLLPTARVVGGCRFGCLVDAPRTWCEACRARAGGATNETEERRPPFETLPLGITEDQLLGTLDLEQALKEGERRFDPGLLARVNNGVLYVDEVNLLEDHIVDLLLDVSVSGINVVAREGVSTSHPAEFLLIGTMNPEEGELRPQLLDRFGLCVEIGHLPDPEERARVVERCLEFEADPEAFADEWREEEQRLVERIGRARELLPSVTVDRDFLLSAARLSLELAADGHRPDLLLIKGAMTLCALDGRRELQSADLELAAPLVYSHRVRRQPFEEQSLDAEEIERHTREAVRVEPSGKKKERLS